MKYKAKDEFKKVKNPVAIMQSIRKAKALLAGEAVEITAPTKEMLKYITKEARHGTGN